jgi:hypothetical protein
MQGADPCSIRPLRSRTSAGSDANGRPSDRLSCAGVSACNESSGHPVIPAGRHRSLHRALKIER